MASLTRPSLTLCSGCGCAWTRAARQGTLGGGVALKSTWSAAGRRGAVLGSSSSPSSVTPAGQRGAMAAGMRARTTRRLFHGSSAVRQQDYYELLGVARDADAKEIKKKYRALAKKYHPDSSEEEDATAKFQEITHAYEVLSDPEKRQAYDSFGPNFEQMGGMGGGAGGGPGGFGGFGGFEEFFQGGFSQGGFNQGPAQVRNEGEDLAMRVSLSFDEAVRGCQKQVTYVADAQCGVCEGNGARAGEKPEYKTCSACNGQGVQMRTLGGFIQVPQQCTACSGAGRTITNKCSSCSGSGIEHNVRQTLSLDIPAGVDSGMTMTRSGAGNAGRLRGPNGDLHIEFAVARDSVYERRGNDVYTECAVSLAQAVLGGKVPVDTLDGGIDLKVPQGISNGEVRRLRGKGITHVNAQSRRGDHYVSFKVQMPSELTDRQRELMLEFDEEERKKELDGSKQE